MSGAQAKLAPSGDPAGLPEHQRNRRNRIVSAALELLETGEYDRIQMRDVAERAGVALGTVYRYFTSKEHLYAAVLVEWVTASLETLAAADHVVEKDDNAERRLRRALHRTVHALRDWPQIVRTEMQLDLSSDLNARELVGVLWLLYASALRGSLWDVERVVADDIVDICSSEAYRSMRSWALGRCSLDEVDRRLDNAVTLIFSPPPT